MFSEDYVVESKVNFYTVFFYVLWFPATATRTAKKQN